MGQVIAFPKQRRHSHEWMATTLNTVFAVVYLLGFFVVGPSLVMFGFAFALGAQPVAALMCVGALLVDWAVTKAAYTRL
jgi:hypothetical protein